MSHRILVVEDNPLNSELLRDWLEMEGYDTVIAPDLDAAFAAFESQPPNAVLLDVQLGDQDGLSLAVWMRQQPALRQVPVIAVTAQALVSERQRILDSGCDSIVPKPVDLNALRGELILWLNHPGLVQANRSAGER